MIIPVWKWLRETFCERVDDVKVSEDLRQNLVPMKNISKIIFCSVPWSMFCLSMFMNHIKEKTKKETNEQN